MPVRDDGGRGVPAQGYRVVETGGGGADGGVDLRLVKGAEKFLVQCKQSRAFKVGVEVVRELYGVMAAEGAAGGFVVTSGSFTAAACRFADGRNLQLLDGPALHDMLRQVQSPQGSTPRAKVVQLPGEGAVDPALPPACPNCATPMVKRRGKRGAIAGSEFWGCSSYPLCRGTRRIAGPGGSIL